MCVKRWGYTNEPKSGLAGSGLPTWPHVKADLMQYIFPGEERPEPAGVSLGPTLAWAGCREVGSHFGTFTQFTKSPDS